MECMNVFVTCNAMTFDVLLPSRCKYADLVEIISAEMKVDKRTSRLKIDYDVGDNVAPMNMTNDNSLMFYMELEKNDLCITTYALRVEVVKMSIQNLDEVEQE
ncbi:Hypothetical predicted protein, partial [Olea europaea subsp. europaea]